MIRPVGVSLLLLGAVVHCQHRQHGEVHQDTWNDQQQPEAGWGNAAQNQWNQGTGIHLSGMVPRNDAPLPNPVQLNHAQLPQFVPQQGHQPGLQPGGLPPPANQLPLDPMFDFLTEPLAEGLNPIQEIPDLTGLTPSDIYIPRHQPQGWHSSGHSAEGPAETGITYKPILEEPSTEKYQPPTLNRVHATEARVKSPHEGPTHGHSGPHTGLHRGLDEQLAAKPPLPDYKPYPQPIENEYAGALEEELSKNMLDSWHSEAASKNQVYVEQYKNKKAFRGENFNVDYRKSNAFHPSKHFFNKKEFNVTHKDIGSINYPLLPSPGRQAVDYKVLRGTPNGRHLLLVNLLENIDQPYWKSRCRGMVQYILPDALKDPMQPRPSKNSLILNDITKGGKIITRAYLVKEAEEAKVYKPREFKDMSRFIKEHKAAVRALVSLALSQETFDATLSYLVTIKEIVSPRVFSEAVLHVIDGRDDVGFIIPSLVSVNPYDYFPMDSIKNRTALFKPKRMRRQAPGGGPWMGGNQQLFPGGQFGQGAFPGQPGLGFPGQPGQPGMPGMPGQPGMPPMPPQQMPGLIGNWRVSWNDGDFRTLPTSDPESLMWYFREDPMVSAHHFHWHMKMSNNQVPSWHPAHGLNMDRRGELFYFMHKQVNCRFNADRLALGLGLIQSLHRQHWTRPISPGYDPKISQSSGRPYPPRPDGALIPLPQDLIDAENALRQAIRDRQLNMPTGGLVRLGYANGVDFGISALGDATEAFEQSDVYGSIHNDGHAKIGAMHGENGALGVMGTPNVAMRDPLFYQWHKYIDDLLQEYKNTLPAYGDTELDFPGVNITAAHVQSERVNAANSLFTFMDTNTIRLQSIDFIANPSGSIFIEYDRLNHVPYTYHVNVHSERRTQGLLRIFLIPAGIRLPAHTDVTQVAIEMDRFLIHLHPGDNYFARHSSRSPFITKSPMPIGDLQDRLLAGNITEDEFNWSGCGWPESMVLPRGRENGMTFRLYMMVSRVLDRDSAITANWDEMQFSSWSWCGVRRNDGNVPDSRPMGFPLDRRPPNGNWQSLMYGRGGRRRGNHFTSDVTISHDPVGTTDGGGGRAAAHQQHTNRGANARPGQWP